MSTSGAVKRQSGGGAAQLPRAAQQHRRRRTRQWSLARDVQSSLSLARLLPVLHRKVLIGFRT